MFESIVQFVESEQLLIANDRVLVAVSGGIDSMVLLDVVCRLRDRYNLDVHVVHLDHQLRPDSSEDAAFVANQAKQRQLPCTVESQDVRALAKQIKNSLEAAGRYARYAFLRRLATAQKSNRIVLGHNKNDQAETFFLNLIRGAGLQGLSGMQAKEDLYVRPLLASSRLDIEAYAKTYDIAYREDQTNTDLRFRRNWIRHKLMPNLESINPNLTDTLFRTQRVFRQAVDFLGERAAKVFDASLVNQIANEIALERNALQKLHPALQAEVIRLTIKKLMGNLDQVTEHHLTSVQRAINDERSGKKIELPQGWCVWTHSKIVQFVPNSETKTVFPSVFLQVPGQTRWGNWTFHSDVHQVQMSQELMMKSRKTSDHLSVRMDWSTIEAPLIVRARKPGDRMDPLGLKGQKKIQDIFVDAKVPRTQREEIPLVEDDRGILWAVGCCQSERTKLNKTTKTILEIEAVKDSSESKRGDHG